MVPADAANVGARRGIASPCGPLFSLERRHAEAKTRRAALRPSHGRRMTNTRSSTTRFHAIRDSGSLLCAKDAHAAMDATAGAPARVIAAPAPQPTANEKLAGETLNPEVPASHTSERTSSTRDRPQPTRTWRGRRDRRTTTSSPRPRLRPLGGTVSWFGGGLVVADMGPATKRSTRGSSRGQDCGWWSYTATQRSRRVSARCDPRQMGDLAAAETARLCSLTPDAGRQLAEHPRHP